MEEQSKKDLSGICQVIDKAVDVEKIYLFGSYAYGMPTPESDYDLCVVIPDGGLRPAEAVKQIRRALYPLQATPMDIIVYRASAFLQRQGYASLESKIAREGVVLYDAFIQPFLGQSESQDIEAKQELEQMMQSSL